MSVPWIGKFIKSPDDLQVFNILTVANELGRPYIVSPQVPRERLEILRTAFEAAMKDKTLVAIRSEAPVGARLRQRARRRRRLIGKLGQAPQAVRERATQRSSK